MRMENEAGFHLHYGVAPMIIIMSLVSPLCILPSICQIQVL